MRRLLAALVAAVTLAACTPVSPETARRARDLRDGLDGDPVVLQLPAIPRTLDPFAAEGSAEQRLAQIQFRPMVSGDDGRTVPGMVTGWAPDATARSVTLTVTRDRWSDGTAVSPDDLLASLEAHLDPRTRSPYADLLLGITGARDFREGRAPTVAGLVVVGPSQVRVDLDDPNPRFVDAFIGVPVLPHHVYRDREAMVTADYRHPPVGSGPYLVAQWEGDGVVRFVPSPVTPVKRLRGLVARPVARADAGRELAAQRLDVADAHDLRPDALPAGVRLDAAPGDGLLMLAPASTAVADPRVRRALLHAVDRAALVREGLAGRGRVAGSVLFQTEWAAPAAVAYDPARARALLAETGWDPARVLTIAVPRDDPRPELWRAVTNQLGEVGVQAEVVPTEGTTPADLLVGTWRPAQRHPWLVEGLVGCSAHRVVCDPALDALVRDATAAPSPDEEIRRWRAVGVALDAGLPVLPLVVPDSSVAVSETLARIAPTQVPLNGGIGAWTRVA
ncbi:hypothetical protein GCM10027418_03790 [Mariniluteicoccus endophyticus]